MLYCTFSAKLICGSQQIIALQKCFKTGSKLFCIVFYTYEQLPHSAAPPPCTHTHTHTPAPHAQRRLIFTGSLPCAPPTQGKGESQSCDLCKSSRTLLWKKWTHSNQIEVLHEKWLNENCCSRLPVSEQVCDLPHLSNNELVCDSERRVCVSRCLLRVGRASVRGTLRDPRSLSETLNHKDHLRRAKERTEERREDSEKKRKTFQWN